MAVYRIILYTVLVLLVLSYLFLPEQPNNAHEIINRGLLWNR